MAPAAVRRLHANTREFKYYASHEALVERQLLFPASDN
jgi:hypothetical protein